MSVQGWKWWQWLIVSLIIGALIGWSLSTREMDDPSLPSLSLQNFVRKLHLRTDDGQPILTKIRVSPITPDNNGKPMQVVTFWERMKNKETLKWEPVRQYRLYTAIPIFPKAPRPDYGALDFLKDQQKEIPNLDIGYGWLQVPRNAWIASMVGSVLVIGVLWPLTIRGLVKLGLGNPELPEEAGYDLSKVRTTSTARAGAAKPTDEDAAELAALNAKLEEQVGGMLIEADEHDEAEERRQEAAVIRKLSDMPLEAEESATKNEENRSFDGEFYPVARPATKSE